MTPEQGGIAHGLQGVGAQRGEDLGGVKCRKWAIDVGGHECCLP